MSLGELSDLLGYVVVYAPDFPQEDFLSDDEQPDLDNVFDAIEEGLDFLPAYKLGDREDVKVQLTSAKSAFAEGDARSGCAIIQKLRYDWFRL